MTRLRPELLDEFLADHETPEDFLGDEGLFKQLKKALLDGAPGAELSDTWSTRWMSPAAGRAP